MDRIRRPGTARPAVLEDGQVARADDQVAELTLLLPAHHLAALEALARGRGLTTAQLLRCLVRACLVGPEGDRPPTD